MVRRVLFLLVAALTGSLLMTAGAAAAPVGSEFGDTCVGSQGGGPFDAIYETYRQESPLPTGAPASGVLTKWIVRTAVTPPESLPLAVRVVRAVGSEVEVVVKSSLETLRSGTNEFETRLPVEAGDHLALGSNEAGAIACGSPLENDQAIGGGLGGAGNEAPQPGERAPFQRSEEAVPVSGVVELDVDGDGFGDLTQDGCPQSADFHGACPTVRFAPDYTVGTSALQVRVKSSAKARIAVSGVLPGLSTSLGTRKTIAAKKFTSFSLPIPPALKSQLHRLDSTRSLRVRLVARVNHVTGNISTDRLNVRLEGRG